MLITPEYVELNRELHKENSMYGTSGAQNAPDVLRLAATINTQDILDYGCGKSTLANNLPFAIKQYDPAVYSHSELPKPASIVVCTDVLEHIEPDCVDNVVEHLHSLTMNALYVSIATRLAKKTLSDGRNAHLSIHPLMWWLSKFEGYFDILDVRAFYGDNEMKSFKATFISPQKRVKK